MSVIDFDVVTGPPAAPRRAQEEPKPPAPRPAAPKPEAPPARPG